METKEPLISVVTACLNRADLISKAIESVKQQNYPNIEHIIVDGGSTDGTLELLKNYSHLRVYSEPDRGVYDGFNKGVALARGEIVSFLNSDDFYEPDVFDEVAEYFIENPDVDVVCGQADVLEDVDHGGGYRTVAVLDYLKGNMTLADSTNKNSLRAFVRGMTMRPPPTNAHFFRREVFTKHGLFDLQYRRTADRDFLIRLAVADVKIALIEREIYHYLKHQGSITLGKFSDSAWIYREKEVLSMTEKYLGRNNIPLEVYNACKEWHKVVSLDFAGYSLRRGNFLETVRCLVRGTRANFSWPFFFLADSARYLLHKDKKTNE